MMRLYEMRNMEEVKDIFLDPELFDRVSESGAKEEGWFLNEDALFLGMDTEDGTVGIWEIEQFNATTIVLHCNLLKKYRKKYAPYAGRAVLDYFVSVINPDFKKAIAFVPATFPDVMRYCEKNALKQEGTITGAIKKQDDIVDLHVYGITRDEARRFLEG